MLNFFRKRSRRENFMDITIKREVFKNISGLAPINITLDEIKVMLEELNYPYIKTEDGLKVLDMYDLKINSNLEGLDITSEVKTKIDFRVTLITDNSIESISGLYELVAKIPILWSQIIDNDLNRVYDAKNLNPWVLECEGCPIIALDVYLKYQFDDVRVKVSGLSCFGLRDYQIEFQNSYNIEVVKQFLEYYNRWIIFNQPGLYDKSIKELIFGIEIYTKLVKEDQGDILIIGLSQNIAKYSDDAVLQLGKVNFQVGYCNFTSHVQAFFAKKSFEVVYNNLKLMPEIDIANDLIVKYEFNEGKRVEHILLNKIVISNKMCGYLMHDLRYSNGKLGECVEMDKTLISDYFLIRNEINATKLITMLNRNVLIEDVK